MRKSLTPIPKLNSGAFSYPPINNPILIVLNITGNVYGALSDVGTAPDCDNMEASYNPPGNKIGIIYLWITLNVQQFTKHSIMIDPCVTPESWQWFLKDQPQLVVRL